MTTLAWFNVFPSNETQTGSIVPPGTRTISTSIGSAAYNAWLGNGSYNGLQVFTGPFNTQQEATQDITSKHPGPGSFIGVVSGILIGAGNENPNAAINNAQTAQNILGGFNLSSWFMRIGEILLGLVLLGVGLARLTHAQNTISQIVKTRLP